MSEEQGRSTGGAAYSRLPRRVDPAIFTRVAYAGGATGSKSGPSVPTSDEPAMQRPLLLACLLTLLSVETMTAQGFRPIGAMPMVPPVLPHPGLLAQPSTPPAAAPAQAAPCEAMPPGDPATDGPKLEGKELARAIAKVTALKWFDDLGEARLESAATGKPILWLQSLGDLDGFA